jgi:hypothetical protein
MRRFLHVRSEPLARDFGTSHLDKRSDPATSVKVSKRLATLNRRVLGLLMLSMSCTASAFFHFEGNVPTARPIHRTKALKETN